MLEFSLFFRGTVEFGVLGVEGRLLVEIVDKERRSCGVWEAGVIKLARNKGRLLSSQSLWALDEDCKRVGKGVVKACWQIGRY